MPLINRLMALINKLMPLLNQRIIAHPKSRLSPNADLESWCKLDSVASCAILANDLPLNEHLRQTTNAYKIIYDDARNRCLLHALKVSFKKIGRYP